NITVPGRLLILVANSPGVALSRRIEAEEERARLTAIVERFVGAAEDGLVPDAGYILRTSAIGASEAELKQDALWLSQCGRDIAERRRKASVPGTLHTDLGPVERALRDEVDDSIDRIVIDDREAMKAAQNYAARAMPGMAGKIELYSGKTPLFEAHGIED